MASSLLLLNGPNLNLLGTREPGIYGSATLADVISAAEQQAKVAQVRLDHFQSNHEGEMLERIHRARQEGVDAIIINPGAWTHTSIALRDALSGVAIQFVELHISNVHQRETFRHHSYLSGIAKAVICGFGIAGYRYAIDFAIENM